VLAGISRLQPVRDAYLRAFGSRLSLFTSFTVFGCRKRQRQLVLLLNFLFKSELIVIIISLKGPRGNSQKNKEVRKRVNT
jgi:hypothetical protein